MSNSPSRSRGAFLRPGFATLLHRPRTRGGGAPIRHPYILTLRQVAPGYFKGLAFHPCAALTAPLPSSGCIIWNRDRAQGRSCAAWNKLSASFVRSVRREGRHSDGGNLYLQVANGGKSWVFQYQRYGRQRDMGLGSARSVSLALARELRDDCHVKLARGLDPIEARNSAVLAARAEHAKQMTFRECVEDYLAVNASKWRNAKHRKEWLATLTRYAYPVFGNLSVAAIDSGLVFKALRPLVAEKPVTASRVRGRIEPVLDFARAAGRRDGDNPADKAIIGHLLPMRSEKASGGHQPARPFSVLPKFTTELRNMPGLPARLLELIILTGMRLDAVRPARCAEFDLGAAVPEWVIPQSRMKNLGRDQRVPLVGRALAIALELTAG